jgi:hypothetical protein
MNLSFTDIFIISFFNKAVQKNKIFLFNLNMIDGQIAIILEAT